jgi:hypothetical protein
MALWHRRGAVFFNYGSVSGVLYRVRHLMDLYLGWLASFHLHVHSVAVPSDDSADLQKPVFRGRVQLESHFLRSGKPNRCSLDANGRI